MQAHEVYSGNQYTGAVLISCTEAEEFNPEQLQLRVFKGKNYKEKGRLGSDSKKYYKEKEEVRWQFMAQWKVTGYLKQTQLNTEQGTRCLKNVVS